MLRKVDIKNKNNKDLGFKNDRVYKFITRIICISKYKFMIKLNKNNMSKKADL